MLPGMIASTSTTGRAELGWQPRHDFRALIARLRGEDIRSPLARGKGYHGAFREGPTVE